MAVLALATGALVLWLRTVFSHPLAYLATGAVWVAAWVWILSRWHRRRGASLREAQQGWAASWRRRDWILLGLFSVVTPGAMFFFVVVPFWPAGVAMFIAGLALGGATPLGRMDWLHPPQR